MKKYTTYKRLFSILSSIFSPRPFLNRLLCRIPGVFPVFAIPELEFQTAQWIDRVNISFRQIFRRTKVSLGDRYKKGSENCIFKRSFTDLDFIYDWRGLVLASGEAKTPTSNWSLSLPFRLAYIGVNINLRGFNLLGRSILCGNLMGHGCQITKDF